jgi:diguanylate cyclase (GGDEF)-like protein/PAS domain S-box-containing protein
MLNFLEVLFKQAKQATTAYIHNKHGIIFQLSLAVVLMLLALWVRLEIAPVNAGLQYVAFFPAVTLAAIAGGLLPGLFATFIGVLFATFIFTTPYYSISIGVLKISFWSNLVFIMDGFIVSYSINAMHKYRHKLEIKFKEAENTAEQLRVAAIAFETHDAIIITDGKANIIHVNQAFQRITGYSTEEVIGKNPRIFSSGRQDKNFYANMWCSLLDTGKWRGEVWDRNRSGNIYPKDMSITAVKNAHGVTTQYVAIFTDITNRKQAEEAIHNLAFYDVLTGLPNRRLFLDRLGMALAVSIRNKHFGALMFLDMDKFKALNDTLGHDFGDMLLIEVANRLKFCVREIDTVARLGGDEFVVVIEGICENEEEASQHAAQVAEKIRSVLATPYRLKEYTHCSSPSIGVCLYFGNNHSVAELIKHADTAMYQAKLNGRNRVQFFDPQLQHLMEIRGKLESDLRRAIPGQQLRLHYQIQLDNAQRAIGAEALVRWMHPERGMISPAEFIPIAEESLLILDLGNWVLDTACRQIAAWSQNELTRDLVLAVNISAQQFKQANFIEQIDAMLNKHGIEPSRLKLELTESIALSDIDTVVAKMLMVRQMLGVTLSLDDFGTGYSSLSYLKKLPLDQIKIDQSFVRDITTDASDAIMVKTIIHLAQNFGLNVIAEGVETEAQFAFLRENGCMAFQGYLFSKPVSIEQFEALLSKFNPALAL